MHLLLLLLVVEVPGLLKHPLLGFVTQVQAPLQSLHVERCVRVNFVRLANQFNPDFDVNLRELLGPLVLLLYPLLQTLFVDVDVDVDELEALVDCVHESLDEEVLPLSEDHEMTLVVLLLERV